MQNIEKLTFGTSFFTGFVLGGGTASDSDSDRRAFGFVFFAAT